MLKSVFYPSPGRNRVDVVNKLFQITRLTSLFIVLICMHIGATAKSQTVTFRVKQEPITNVLAAVEAQTGYMIVYNDRYVKPSLLVTLEVKDQPLEVVLDKLLSPRSLSYNIQGKTIAIRGKRDKNTSDSGLAERSANQQRTITGRVSTELNEPLEGVTVTIKGTATAVTTNANGNYRITVPGDDPILVFTTLGFETRERLVGTQSTINISMKGAVSDLDEVVVVGYGTQKKRDITGSVASIPQERLQNVPNTNITQAMQGAIPGLAIATTSAGVAPGNNETSIMIRGRNSIRASNNPLIVVDGVAYYGELRDINVNDIQSVEVLKDASAAAIYGSRGANGVILITTKEGSESKPQFNYNGYYSMQQYTNLPDLLNGEQFYQFKSERVPNAITPSEQRIYDAGEWVDWFDLAFRPGKNFEQNISATGGFNGTRYYLSLGYNDIDGLARNDQYERITGRVNLDTKIAYWLTIGTKNQFTYDNRDGIAPTLGGDNGVFKFSPLSRVYDDNGQLTIFPVEEDTFLGNPLRGLLATDIMRTNQLISNNYATVDFPFLKGLQYRLNTGVRMRFSNTASYHGRDTREGLLNLGEGRTGRTQYNNTVIENLLNYRRSFGPHDVFATIGYNYEYMKTVSESILARGFPNDFLLWYRANQAEFVQPSYGYEESTLLSSMFRVNYTYDSRYLLTVTGRRDGFSGFGARNKWGFFPSVAIGWNIADEDFFQLDSTFDQLKLRLSWGRNGNQAVGPYQTISELTQADMVAGSTTMPGYRPNRLGQDNLGWESTATLNAGLDFSLWSGRLSGDINVFRSNTTGLLLNRSISSVHGLTSITQNIGATNNRGVEINLISNNLKTKDFSWRTQLNGSLIRNKIVSLYGILDENGQEVDDVGNAWFINRPISQIYGVRWIGVWQTEEAEQAAAYRTRPGFIKIEDVNGDGRITPDDRTFLGQGDPTFLWGLTNTFSYRNFTLNTFIHGVHGVTKQNTLLTDNVTETVRRNTIWKNWWTPDNPTNDWYMNHPDAHLQDGQTAYPYENASFIRIKDISLAYDVPQNILDRFGINRFQVYVTGRNLFTLSNYGGLDPELGGQEAIPIQKEYVVGARLTF